MGCGCKKKKQVEVQNVSKPSNINLELVKESQTNNGDSSKDSKKNLTSQIIDKLSKLK